jgi:N-formylglutamate deformylase
LVAEEAKKLSQTTRLAPLADNFHAQERFLLSRATQPCAPILFCSPHSGRAYTADFLNATRLDLLRLRASEDAFVDALFQPAPKYGASLLCAVAPRAYIDLNRSPYELDPALITGVPRRPLSTRVAAGLGVAPRIVAEGIPIYASKITLQDVERRISLWYHPFHVALRTQLSVIHAQYGWVLLLDCHSMPARAQPGSQRSRHDIVLGDRHGSSASRTIVDQLECVFMAQGFRVARNVPFAGGFITEHYGQPKSGYHAVQIEIDRGVYLDEARVEKGKHFADIQQRIEAIIARICAFAFAQNAAVFAAE